MIKKENKLTREQYNALKPAEQYFYTVKHYKFKRSSPTTINKTVKKIYNEHYKTNKKFNFGCSSCVFKLYESMANIYFENKEFWELCEKRLNNRYTQKNKQNGGKEEKESKAEQGNFSDDKEGCNAQASNAVDCP